MGGQGGLPLIQQACLLLQLLGPLRLFLAARVLFALAPIKDLNPPTDRGFKLLHGAGTIVQGLAFSLECRSPGLQRGVGLRCSPLVGSGCVEGATRIPDPLRQVLGMGLVLKANIAQRFVQGARGDQRRLPLLLRLPHDGVQHLLARLDFS
ncbi:Os01g0668900 [Oryza sativa Japonica Group]|uniref:Os01g0668900 protein n=1 Tax=Oryza sativa subsp. japonica TaxID=39947 RepID=Q0JKJ5_ORYSJ|nr:Os01g0668900 [Oryza sativa Japonica Group]|eukprot:NP_001043819.1 Os01g0668900 [Oryza sativa Japonica Group]